MARRKSPADPGLGSKLISLLLRVVVRLLSRSNDGTNRSGSMRNPVSRKKRGADLGLNGANISPTAIEARFAEAQSRLGPHRQQLIRAIVDHCEETSFLSSR